MKDTHRMALANFTLPFGGSVAASNWAATITPIQHHATAVNNLLYGPEGHQKADAVPNSAQYYKNDPYAPPPAHINQRQPQYQHQHHQFQFRSRNNYLPPPPPPVQQQQPKQPQPQSVHALPPLPQAPIHPQFNSQPEQLPPQTQTSFQQQVRTYGENNYQENAFYHENISVSNSFNSSSINSHSETYEQTPAATPQPQLSKENQYPERPTFTQVQAGHGSKTQVHAVLDYDNDEYYEEENITGICHCFIPFLI